MMIASLKTSFYLALVGVCLLGLFSMSPADAAAKKTPPKPPDPRILIKSVDVAKGQVVFTYMRDKRNATYTIDDTTVLTVQGHPGTIKDIEVGMQVFGYVERDEYSLNSLDVKTADAAPVAPK